MANCRFCGKVGISDEPFYDGRNRYPSKRQKVEEDHPRHFHLGYDKDSDDVDKVAEDILQRYVAKGTQYSV